MESASEQEEAWVDVTVKTAAVAFELRGVGLDWPGKRLRELVERHLQVDPERTAVRLLHGGRLLTDEQPLGAALVQRHGGRCAVHAAVSERQQSVARRRRGSNRQQEGDVVLDMEETEEANNGEDDRARGFEQLREAGFSAAEIEELRQQFVAIHGPAARELEERWLNDAAWAGPARVGEVEGGEGVEGTGGHEHLFGGLVCGFAFPPVVVAAPFFMERSLSQAAKAGMVFGAAANALIFFIASLF
jgi:hypothetical protein